MNTTTRTPEQREADVKLIQAEREAIRQPFRSGILTLRTLAGSITLSDRGIKSITFATAQHSSRDASETMGMMLFELDRILKSYKGT